jgi:AAA domain, putative AbiEii toxin, Type IV TA system
MKLVLKDLGAIKGSVEIAPSRLTVLSGGNNTGKTYAMYALWALFEGRRVRHVFAFAERMAEQLKNEGSVTLGLNEFCEKNWATVQKGISDGLRRGLGGLFSAPQANFEQSLINVTLDVEEFRIFAEQHTDFKRTIEVGASSTLDVRLTKSDENLNVALTALNAAKLPTSLLAEIVSSLFVELVLATQIGEVFLLPAERGGLNLFYLDLDAKNSALVRHLKREDSNPMEVFRDMMVAQYALPIDAYIQFLKRAPRLTKSAGHFHDQALALQKDITRVRYKVTKEGVITAKPYMSKAELGIHLTSSTVKSLYGLWAWLELQAEPGDCLMIDEPELNLHPDNQRLVARLLVRLVNRGIRVVVSTHSDYIVREFNNMIMLGTDFDERVQLEKKFGYDQAGFERLLVKDVVAYHFTEKSVEACRVDPAFGIEIKSMDEAINSLNDANSTIYFAVGDAIEQPKPRTQAANNISSARL